MTEFYCSECKPEIERLKAANEALEIMEATARREMKGFIPEIERLRAALRGIYDRYIIDDDPEVCAAAMYFIARAALKEEK